MTQKDLQYVIAIAETGSVSKAAAQLYITQPSLSHALHRIEAEVGTALFMRTPSGLKVTMAGEQYIQTAYEILRSYKVMEAKLSWYNEMNVGRLTVGTTSFLGSVVLPHIIYAFHQLYPNIEIQIVEGVSEKVENAILRGDVDIGIFHHPLSNPSIRFKTLIQEPFLLAIPPDHPINKARYLADDNQYYLDLKLTDGMDYILTQPQQRTRQRCDAILSKAGVTPHIKYITSSIQTATRMAGVGLGITLVPQLYAQLFNQNTLPNFYMIDKAFEPHWELAVCYAREQYLSKPAEEMIRICENIMPYMYTAMNQRPGNYLPVET